MKIAKMLWRGKVPVLAVVIALTLVAGGTAVAKAKLVKATLEYVSNTGLTGAVMKLTNTVGGPALDLVVNPEVAPLTVNSDTKVDNLNADKLDGKDATQLAPTVVAFNGQLVPIQGNSSNFVFAGPTAQVTADGNDRLTGAATATLGRPSGSPSQIAGIDLCYQSTVAGSPVNNFTGFDFVDPPIISTPQSYSASSTVSPGAGTYNVGFCVKNNGTTQITGRVNGWVMVTNNP